MKKAVFLDRDGTLIQDSGYMKAEDPLRLMPGVIEALQKLSAMDYELIVVSNQSGIGRGLISEHDVRTIHQKLSEMLLPFGICISAFYVCPHRPQDGCSCRKPKPGMILRALKERNVDPARSYMIGDQVSDAEAGTAAGVTGVLISSAPGMNDNGTVLIFESLLDFANCIDGNDTI